MDNHTRELEYLLNNYWCVKEKTPQIYFNIKNNLDYYKDFIQTRLGSRLIVNDRFIKLEKIPSVPKAYMGINDFKSKLEYILLMIVLLFLEDKPKEEQFVLSTLIDFITNTATALKLETMPDWNIFHHRKSLENVIKHLDELHIIKVVEAENFTENKEAEGLYETTGISNYYDREFKNNILDYNDISDYINDEFLDQNENQKDVRRYRVYRHLLYSLSSYKDDLTDAEMDYLKRFRNHLSSEISKYTTSELEITQNMALLLYDEDEKISLDFPNKKSISDIVLLVNSNILNKVNNKNLDVEEDETITMSKENFSRIIKETKKENGSYFSKAYRELPINKFIKEVTSYMKDYDMIRENEGDYKIYPIVSKMTGYIPKDENVQTELFGGDEVE